MYITRLWWAIVCPSPFRAVGLLKSVIWIIRKTALNFKNNTSENLVRTLNFVFAFRTYLERNTENLGSSEDSNILVTLLRLPSLCEYVVVHISEYSRV